MQKRILIVGGGLAGSFLAAECLRAGHAVELVDDASKRGASRIAAGMYNIITGRQAVLTWRAQQLLETFKEFFRDERFAPLSAFLHPMPIYRPYRSEDQVREWATQSQGPVFRDFVEHQTNPIPGVEVNDPLGGLWILPCGWLDTIGFLDALHPLLEEKFPFTVHRHGFRHEDLDPQTGTWGDFGTFDQVVFAEGTANAHNPWFSWIDIHPLKGQVLHFTAESSFKGNILLRKSFIIPSGGGHFVSGSTYEHHFSDLEPDEKGISFLKEMAEAALNTEVKVEGARAGIRPTTRDRRPILGRHPEHSRLFFLNGMGTKGVLQAPSCAKWMLACLEGRVDEIPEEVKIERYFEKSAVN